MAKKNQRIAHLLVANQEKKEKSRDLTKFINRLGKKLAKVQQREEKLTNTKKQHIQRIDNLTIKLDQVRQILGQENQELRDKLQKLQLRQDSGYWDDEYEVDLEPKNFDRTTQTKIITFSSQETQADLVVEPDQEILSRLNRQQKEITELKNYVLVLEKDFLDAANKNELLEQWYYELEALIRKQDQDLSNLDQLIDSKNERLTTTQKKKEWWRERAQKTMTRK